MRFDCVSPSFFNCLMALSSNSIVHAKLALHFLPGVGAALAARPCFQDFLSPAQEIGVLQCSSIISSR